MKNSDGGEVEIQTARYDGHVVTPAQKLEYFAATRIASAPECFAGICGYWRHHISPTVLMFSIQLEGQKVVFVVGPEDALEKVDNASPLERYFNRPKAPQFDELTFLDYYSQYSLETVQPSDNALPDDCPNRRYANPRRKPILCMFKNVNPSKHEVFALRILLARFPARSWEDFRTHNGQTWQTCYDTIYELGLVIDQNQEAHIYIRDALELGRPAYEIRFLVALMVSYGAHRGALESQFWHAKAEDSDTAQDVHRRLDRLIDRDRYPSLEPRNRNAIVNLPDARRILAQLNDEQRQAALYIISAVLRPNPQNRLMFLQGAAGTGKTFTVSAVIAALQAMRRICLVCATTGIAAVQYPGGTTLHSVFKLGIDENSANGFVDHIGQGTPQAAYILEADLIIVDEVSMLTPWVADRVHRTLLSITGLQGLDFAGRSILFVGDLLQLPPVMKTFGMPVVRRLITQLPYWPAIINFRLERPMRAPQPSWADFVLLVAKGLTDPALTWGYLHDHFGVTITTDIDEAQVFFCADLEPHEPFPLDYQWICPTNKLANQANLRLHNWRKQAAPTLGAFVALTTLTKSLRNCPGLSEPQQNEFVERMDIPDLPPSMLEIVQGNPFILLRNIDTRAGLAKGRRCTAVDMRYRTIVLQFDDGQTFTLTKIPFDKCLNGMTFRQWQVPIREVFAGTVHRSQGMTLQ
jgi:hypothetical protein